MPKYHFSAIRDGDMQDVDNVKRFVRRGFNDSRWVVLPSLQHGDHIEVVKDATEEIFKCDALVTERTDVVLTVKGADCIPVFLWSDNGWIGIVHSGWRGTAKKVAGKAVGTMLAQGAVGIHAHIGPGIRSCCFEVQDDVWNEFYQQDFKNKLPRKFIDLAQEVKFQLTSAGVPAENITDEKICTQCSEVDGRPVYYSYRRTGKSSTGSISQNIAIIGKI